MTAPKPLPGRFAGRTALVTGVAKGIGRVLVERLLAEGAQVAGFDLEPRTAADPDALHRAVAAHAERFLYRSLDVTDEGQVAAGVAATLDRFGAIDILVNNVGKGLDPVPLEDVALADWEFLLRLNLTSAFVCTRAVIAHMKANGRGRIVNVSSQAGRSKSEVSNLPYASAKAGLLGFTRNLAHEVGPFGITVNAVAPGVTLTGRITSRLAQRTEADRAALNEVVPLRRLGSPEEIAAAILFLASDDAAYVTGATLDVNGGRTMM